MNVPLVVAGSTAILAALIHGVGGELLVVRRLSAEALPPTRFGGPRMTRSMIHVSWHLTTVAFLAVGVALLAAGVVLDGEAADAIAVAAAAMSTVIAAVTVALGIAGQPLRSAVVHPGPAILTAVAAFAWWGAL